MVGKPKNVWIDFQLAPPSASQEPSTNRCQKWTMEDMFRRWFGDDIVMEPSYYIYAISIYIVCGSI